MKNKEDMVGKQFKHRNGNVYTVLMFTNTDSTPERLNDHPIDVVYIGQNGKMWSRQLNDWDRSFTEYTNQQKVDTPEEIRKYIGKSQYDEHGQLIFRGSDSNNLQQFLDVRGWGAIQNMGFKTMKEAEAFQDKVGQWVSDVINEKLKENEKDI